MPAALAAASPAWAGLPLGPSTLKERRSVKSVAPGVRLTTIVRSGRGDGPWRMWVLEIQRAALAGDLRAVLANGRVGSVERPSSMARRRHAIAGVNGGYFAIRNPSIGDPVGTLVVDGKLVSEPVGARAALLVPRSKAARIHVANLRFAGSVTVGARSRLVDGVDRVRGRIPACGGLGGDRPIQVPNPFVTCTDPSELVVYTPGFGATTRTGASGWEATIRDGTVTRLRHGGNSVIPPDGLVLSGSGDAAGFLRNHARRGTQPVIDLSLRDGARLIDAGDFRTILSAGPRLMRAGRIDVTWRAEGQDRGASLGRAPRTLVGVRRDGTLVIAAVDGRRPGWSAGVTLPEGARVLRSFGASEAMDFDDGGSTAMVVGTHVLNRPSDPQGERAVSDGLFVMR